MTLDELALWRRYCASRYDATELGLTLDISRVAFPDDFLDSMSAKVMAAMEAMARLEGGATANQDEGRMVGHYWLRAPNLAPTVELRVGIERGFSAVKLFADGVRNGTICGTGGSFSHVLQIGIGGSSLGSNLICEAVGESPGPIQLFFLDNSDPDGLEAVMSRLRGQLGRTLVSVVSKTGATPTPRYIQAAVETAYMKEGLEFARHAVATTMEGTDLDRTAARDRWLARFPIWDWVGGRTSVTSAVGLLPAALRGVDIGAVLQGAAAMDRITSQPDPRANPAALLALMWYWLGNGRGDKNMVILPYSDRLALFGRYVQQLVMESVGKELNRRGDVVRQGLTVFGHKGSTDQHSYLQQLRQGRMDSFITFIGIHKRASGNTVEIEPGITLADHLFGSLEGTRNAMTADGRESITIMLAELSALSLGALIALYERAVGLYAELIDVNAYHQPGVDKNVARPVIDLQRVVLKHLRAIAEPQTAEEIADATGSPRQVETVYKLLDHLAQDSSPMVVAVPGARPFCDRFQLAIGTKAGTRSDSGPPGERTGPTEVL